MLHAAPALAPAPGPWVLGQLETQSLFSLEVTLQTDLSHHYNCQFITISINLGATWEKWPAPQPPREPPLGWLHRQWCQQHRAVACEDPGGPVMMLCSVLTFASSWFRSLSSPTSCFSPHAVRPGSSFPGLLTAAFSSTLELP